MGGSNDMTNAKRLMSALLALGMVLSWLPAHALTARAAQTGCEHHPEHTPDCGYRAASQGAPCKYDALCDRGCVGDHPRDCAYTLALETDLCDRDCADTDGDGLVDHAETCAFALSGGRHTHDGTCGYAPADPGAPCAFRCPQCAALTAEALPEDPLETTTEATVPAATAATVPETTAATVPEETPVQHIEVLIAALPPHVTVDNRDAVTAQLQEILSLYAALTEAEQEQVDITPCVQLQAELDAANVPEPLADNLDVSAGDVVISADGDYTITGSTTTNTITVNAGVTANITLSGVNIDVSATSDAAAFQIADDSTGNVTVTLEGTNTLKSGANCAGLQKNGSTGTLTITGTGSLTAQGGDQAAGIGGGNGGSGTGICITGGTIKATGGTISTFGGAGIGGGHEGGGTVTISGNANVTAQGAASAAGIGAGRCKSIKKNARGTVIIEGGTVIATGGTIPNFSGGCGAGIGAGQSSHADVTITGGVVTATGGSSEGRGYGGAGIGGSGGMGDATVKISGGTVTAKGGDDKNGGAGIGGSGGDNVDVTITGGMVTATGGSNVSSDGSGVPGAGIGQHGSGSGNATFSTGSGNAFIMATGGAGATTNGDGITGGDNTSGWSGIIFNGDEGQVYGSQTLTTNAEIPAGKRLTIPSGAALTVNSTLTNEGTLTIDGGTLSGTGTLGGSGSFVITELTADMITVPTGLFYEEKDWIEYITEHTTLAAKTYCGKAFQVKGWTQSVAKDAASDLIYIVTYTHTNGQTVTKTVTLAQSAATLAAECTDGKTDNAYEYGDTVNIRAMVKATGTAPTKANSRLRGVTAPTSGQVALYEGDAQVCDPQTPDADGTCTFTVPTKALGAGAHTLTVKYTESTVMAQATRDLTVSIAPKPVTVAITPGGGVYGGKIDPATVKLEESALVPGDTAPAVTLTYTGRANDGTEVNSTTPPASAGTYTVTATIPQGNYVLTGQTTAEFQIRRAQCGLTVAPIAAKTYGDADFDLTVTRQGDGSLTYVSNNESIVTVDKDGKAHILGAGTAKLTVAVAETANYAAGAVDVSVTVAKKPVAVAVDSAEKIYGEPDPAFPYTVTGDLVGADTLELTLSAAQNVGANPITDPDTGKNNPNYDITLTPGTLTVQPRDIRDAEVVLGPALTANGKPQTQTIRTVTVKNSRGEILDVTYTVAGDTGTDAGGYEMTLTGTGNFTGEKKQSFAIAPGAGQPVQTDGSGDPVLGKGKITEQVAQGAGAPAVDVPASKAEIIGLLTQGGCLTAQELAQVADGAQLNVVFTTEAAVSADDQSRIKSAARGYTVGSWFDVSLYKQLDGQTPVWLHQTGKPIRLTVQVPQDLLNTRRNVKRTFWVVRCHDGAAQFLPTRYDDAGKTLSFETDRFSAYAIVYKDAGTADGIRNTATGTIPPTGDTTHIALWTTLLLTTATLLLTTPLHPRKKQKR